MVLPAALRCAGVPAVFVRSETQSGVRFFLDGKKFSYFPAFDQPLNEMTPEVDAYVAGRAEVGQDLEGLDPRDVGMHSILDFWIGMGRDGLRHQKRFKERFRDLLKKQGLLKD